MLEAGAIDWTRDSQPDNQSDSITAGDILLRLGLADHFEAQLGWTAYGHVRVRDHATGTRQVASGTGDLRVALRRNLRDPDGQRESLAVMGFVVLPTGTNTIGTREWATGLLLPTSWTLPANFSLAFTPEIDLAANVDGHGHHAFYGTVIGLGRTLSSQLTATVEMSGFRDEDPAGHSAPLLAGMAIAWQPGDNLQLDLGGNAGLNRDAPNTEFYVGVARRF